MYICSLDVDNAWCIKNRQSQKKTLVLWIQIKTKSTINRNLLHSIPMSRPLYTVRCHIALATMTLLLPRSTLYWIMVRITVTNYRMPPMNAHPVTSSTTEDRMPSYHHPKCLFFEPPWKNLRFQKLQVPSNLQKWWRTKYRHMIHLLHLTYIL